MPGVLKVDNLLGIQAGYSGDPMAMRPAPFPGGTEARASVVGDAAGE
jgi:hypothetical protein